MPGALAAVGGHLELFAGQRTAALVLLLQRLCGGTLAECPGRHLADAKPDARRRGWRPLEAVGRWDITESVVVHRNGATQPIWRAAQRPRVAVEAAIRRREDALWSGGARWREGAGDVAEHCRLQ